MPLLQPPGPDLRPFELTYTDAYSSIVSRVRRRGGSGSGSVVVFVGVDVDGLLASRILVSLFRQDDIPYRIIPIGGYAELEDKTAEALESEELHTLILLSIGAVLPNLESFFDLPAGVHLHVIDSHRPWALESLFDVDNVDEDGVEANQIWIWGDGDESKLDEVKKSWEALQYNDVADSDDEEDEDDDEDDEDEEEADDEEEGEESETEEGEGRKRGRQGSSRPKKKRRRGGMAPAAREAHARRIENYYSAGTHFGMSSAQVVYLLATMLERADNDLLWWAIIAVTCQYASAQIDRDQYDIYQEVLSDEVARLNPEAAKVPNPDDRRISSSEEFRFVLFRHWNLFDSMLHSGYVAGRLGIWKEQGKKRLRGLLAKMGFPLQQAQQSYLHMDMALKRDLPNKLEAIAPEYGLVELVYPSFVRSYGFFLAAMSAADAVEALQALLEAAHGIRLETEVEGGAGGGEWFGGLKVWRPIGNSGVNGDESTPASRGDTPEGDDPKKEQQWHVANFWTAYDACDEYVWAVGVQLTSSIKELRHALPLAKTLHHAIVRQGSAILDKASIKKLRTFRFAAVSEGPDLRLFSHPALLSRLAVWLVDATRDKWSEGESHHGKHPKSLPFVLACLNEEKDIYSVIGFTGAPEFDSVRKNKFSLAFTSASQESGIGSRQDMFDQSFVEVHKGDLLQFIEAVQLRSL
ncbi:Cell division control protein 45 [Vanrija pseudolonga]|uniref:Cell division control protein 45 n=1 Tax=Vanrija pseudolonga TaxID=143232 RepID=A0AAF0Y4S4_9TREE|nr:Cell division control protein 45 [Vanrija pseudolonga]